MECSDDNKYVQIKEDFENTKSSITNSLQKIIERDNNIEITENETENLNTASINFANQSQKIKKKIIWQNIRHNLIIICVISIIIFVILISICGITFDKC